MKFQEIAVLPEPVAVRPLTEVEEATMPRARSAVMRVARKLGGGAA